MSNVTFTLLDSGFLYQKQPALSKTISSILEWNANPDTGSIYFITSSDQGNISYYFNAGDTIQISENGTNTTLSGNYIQVISYLRDNVFNPNLQTNSGIAPNLNSGRPFNASGQSGTSGFSGASGAAGGGSGTGSSGASGTSGTSGKSGTSGYSGTSGAGGTGTSGTSGTSGISGTSGKSGTSGTSGASGSGGSGTVIERAATYSAITASTATRLIFVHADETQDSNKTMYAYVNAESPPLQFLQIIL